MRETILSLFHFLLNIFLIPGYAILHALGLAAGRPVNAALAAVVFWILLFIIMEALLSGLRRPFRRGDRE